MSYLWMCKVHRIGARPPVSFPQTCRFFRGSRWRVGVWPWAACGQGTMHSKNISSLFKSFSYSLCLTLRHIEGVSHLTSGSGLQPLYNQCFGLRVNLRHVVRGQVAVDVKVWCAGVIFIHTNELIDQSVNQHPPCGVVWSVLRVVGCFFRCALLPSLSIRPFYTAKPVRSRLGTPGDFTVLSQDSCVKANG